MVIDLKQWLEKEKSSYFTKYPSYCSNFLLGIELLV